MEALRTALRTAGTLLFPVECGGCGAADVSLCGACAALLVPQERRRTVDGITVHSALDYGEGVVANVFAAFKEQGRTTLATVLAPCLTSALAAVRAPDDAIVVAVPSSVSAMRRRGYRPLELVLARAGVHPVRLLRVRGRPEDQRSLSAAERARNVAGAFRVRTGRSPTGVRCVLVDDVVTTGSTVRAASAALAAAGVHVIAAATVAQTPRRGRAP